MKTWKKLRGELLKDKEVRTEYKRLVPQFSFISQLIEARTKRGLTQAQLAAKVGTKQSAIARIESGSANISIAQLEKLTQALDSQLVIRIQ